MDIVTILFIAYLVIGFLIGGIYSVINDGIDDVPFVLAWAFFWPLGVAFICVVICIWIPYSMVVIWALWIIKWTSKKDFDIRERFRRLVLFK